MFSGIVEEMATVVSIKRDGENVDITLECSFAGELKIDQSVSCSNLGQLEAGSRVNVERSMMMNGRLDGHIVQGHVDRTARCVNIEDADGSSYFTFEYDYDKAMAERGYFTVDKGSVTVNGVSLTVCNPTDNTFKVAIIPYTMEHTNFCDIKCGTVVNIEFDILGKYIARLNSLK